MKKLRLSRGDTKPSLISVKSVSDEPVNRYLESVAIRIGKGTSAFVFSKLIPHAWQMSSTTQML